MTAWWRVICRVLGLPLGKRDQSCEFICGGPTLRSALPPLVRHILLSVPVLGSLAGPV